MKIFLSKQMGLTVIELLIAISIIGIIAFTIPHFMNVQQRANNQITQASNDLLQGHKVIKPIVDELKFGINYSLPSENTINYDDDRSGTRINCSISFIGGDIILTRGGTTRIINTRNVAINNLRFIRVPDNTPDTTKHNRTINIILTLQDGTEYQTTVFALNGSDNTPTPTPTP